MKKLKNKEIKELFAKQYNVDVRLITRTFKAKDSNKTIIGFDINGIEVVLISEKGTNIRFVASNNVVKQDKLEAPPKKIGFTKE